MDRRGTQRCPVCQGPGTEDAGLPDGVRCRRSICIQNHGGVACPRCKQKDLESVDFKDKHWVYRCAECTNTWKVEAS